MADFKHLDALLKEFAANGLPGCGCAVAKDGKVLYEGYHGMADIEWQRPIAQDTVYRLYSMTKVVICTAAMMLYERGQYLLSDPIYEYIPEYRERSVVHHSPNGGVAIRDAKTPALIRHAFTMAVGLPYGFGDTPTTGAMRQINAELEAKHGKGMYSIVDEAKAIARVPAAFEAGEHFLYGYGHDIVAALIQVISGKSVWDFLREEIFGPLGMDSTGYRYFGDIRQRMATLYRRDASGGAAAPGTAAASAPAAAVATADRRDHLHEANAKLESGGAGLFSTVGDYLKFTQMLANGGMHGGRQIIGRKTIDLMRQNHLSEQQLKDFGGVYLAGYGYGLGVRTMMDLAAGGSNTSVGEFGWTGALGTWASIDPSEGASVVYMHQTSPNMEEYYHLRTRAAAYGGLK
ncbi:MAG: beta-lactamase family protein [Oscillospiraceae bacterium]|nr:beta-lactamase family protein [Oscillospiraceae bacterium]